MNGPTVGARLGSALLRFYLRFAPLSRGKYRLGQWAAARFLVTRLEGGAWMRVHDYAYAWERLFCVGRPPEAVTRRLYRRLLAPGMTVLDIGANVGVYTLEAAGIVGSSGAVHAFEPVPDMVARLRANVDLNGFDNVVVNATVVCEQDGEVLVRIDADDPDCSGIVFDGSDGDRGVPTAAVTVDSYLDSIGGPAVDLLKADIEGAEVAMLRGAERLLSSEHPPVLLIEVNGPALRDAGSAPAELAEVLNAHGYTGYFVEHFGDDDEQRGNLVAARSEHHERFPALSEIPQEARWETGGWG